ncbi:hypothetical protein [Virgisporangium aurantiacum]|uniref:Uncharacterized protein n=1 Tax=Virgisporangium aurantiacum TaxID=175570 RepID=A0A8J3ZIF4_9ACTN|nr:hypothetical protein [Virgisporangium aurantiacum]GIJ62520.1 hypothetical protein Vau01_100360 [Virgisporangium aurantiacum]
MPNEAIRRSTLCMASTDPGPTQGVVLRLEPHEIVDIGQNKEYACGGPGIRDDLVADGVVRGICSALRGQQPIKIPSNDIIGAVRNLTGNRNLKLTDLALGTRQGLKIGLEFDAGSRREFTSAMSLHTAPAAHWGVNIDPGLIEIAVLEKAKGRFAAGSPWVVTLDGPVTFTRDGFTASVLAVRPAMAGTPACALDFRVRIGAVVHLSAKRDFLDRVIIEQVMSTEEQKPWIGAAACFPWSVLFGHEVVPEPVPVPQDGVCRFRLGDLAMEFPVGDDILYATDVRGDDGLFILGSSDLLTPGGKQTIDRCMV